MSSTEDIINIDSINLNNEFMNEIMNSHPYKRKFTKPIIKWVGGKTDLLDKVITNFLLKLIIIMNRF